MPKKKALDTAKLPKMIQWLFCRCSKYSAFPFLYKKGFYILFLLPFCITSCAEPQKNIEGSSSTLHSGNTFAGSWAAIIVNPCYKHLGFIEGSKEAIWQDATTRSIVAKYKTHFFVDKSAASKKLSNLLLITTATIPGKFFGTEAFPIQKHGKNGAMEKISLGNVVLPSMTKKQPMVGEHIYDFLKQEGYALDEFDDSYSIRISKLCSADMRADVFFFETKSSPDKILESLRRAVDIKSR